MRYDYKVIAVDKSAGPSFIDGDIESNLRVLGEAGWELMSVYGGKAYLKKCASNGLPQGCAKACGNCKAFKAAPAAEKETGELPNGWCEKHKLAMLVTSACEDFAQKDLPGAPTPIPAGALQDENSAFHWQPKTEIGEKKIQAITNQVAGVKSDEHKHQVIVITDAKGRVVRGKTNMINGHEHNVTILGMTEEADGHTHRFDLPQMVSDHSRTHEFPK